MHALSLTNDWFLEIVEALDSVLESWSNRDMVTACELCASVLDSDEVQLSV